MKSRYPKPRANLLLRLLHFAIVFCMQDVSFGASVRILTLLGKRAVSLTRVNWLLRDLTLYRPILRKYTVMFCTIIYLMNLILKIDRTLPFKY